MWVRVICGSLHVGDEWGARSDWWELEVSVCGLGVRGRADRWGGVDAGTIEVWGVRGWGKGAWGKGVGG